MDYKKQVELVKLHIQIRQAADSLHTQAQEVFEMAKRLEDLTKNTTIRYAGLRVRVEARGVQEQAGVLGRVPEQLGERLGE